MNNKAIILGSNYYIGLSIIRCLGSKGIYTVAVDYSRDDTYGSKSKYLKEQIIAPHYKQNPEGLLEFLISFGEKELLKPLLYPSADAYVEFMDTYLDELKKYYLIPMTEKGIWTSVMDKVNLSKKAIENGVLVPETIVETDIDFYSQLESKIRFPCIVKPTNSPAFSAVFRKKMFICNDVKELKESLDLARNENLDVFIQRIISGHDDHMYTFDAYMNKESEVTHWCTCRKMRQYPINYGASVYTEQKYVQELYDLSAPFFKALNYKGFGEIEFKKDAITGKYYLIEINTRTTNLNNLLCKTGINFPYVQYMELTGNPLDSIEMKKDTRYVFRYLLEDLLAIRDYINAKQLSYFQVFRSLFRKKVPAIWNLKDPMPGLVYSSKIIKKVVGRLIRKTRKI